MCVLWFLLQLVVIFLYWDLPLQESGKVKESVLHGGTDAEDGTGLEEEDEDTDEEKPLITTQELVGSYGTVVQVNSQSALNTALDHASSPSPKPQGSYTSSGPGFFSSRGGWSTATWPRSFYTSLNSRLNLKCPTVCRVPKRGGDRSSGCSVHHTLQSDGTGGSVKTQICNCHAWYHARRLLMVPCCYLLSRLWWLR